MTNKYPHGGGSPDAQKVLITPASFEPMVAAGQKQPRVINTQRYMFGVALLLLALFLLHLFTAKSVLIERNPMDASVNIDSLFALKLGQRYLLRPGQYRADVSHDEYMEQSLDFVVGGQAQQSFSVELLRKPDNYQLLIQPLGATVLIDGQAVGETPIAELALSAGEHLIELQHPRYLPYAQTIIVSGGGYSKTLEVAMLAAWAEVHVESSPAGAEFYAGETLLGTTPLTAQVLQGNRQLSLRLDGFNSWSTTQELIAGQSVVLPPVTLEPADARLTIESKPSKASLLLNGQYVGRTPASLDLSAGQQYQLEVFKAGYKKDRRQLEFRTGSQPVLLVTLKPELGEVYLMTDQADAVLDVDGVSYSHWKRQSKSSFSKKIRLSAAPHTIRVKKAGYQTFKTTITPKPGFPQRIKATLTPSKSVAVGANGRRDGAVLQYAQTVTTTGGYTLQLLRPTAFTMGASRREPGRRANEKIRQLSMKRPFYMGVTEVSNAMFKQFSVQHNSGRVDAESLNGPAQPVVSISWVQAAQFCNWLSKKDKLKTVYSFSGQSLASVDSKANGYRLPTEAEWAWAARRSGQGELKYAWGVRLPPPDKAGNFADFSASLIVGRTLPDYNDGFATTAPVGTFSVNQHQIKNLSGNVAEWVHDFYSPGAKASSSSAEIDPFGPEKGAYHVVRGSSWRHGSQVELRLSYRDYWQKTRDDLGFRIVRYAGN